MPMRRRTRADTREKNQNNQSCSTDWEKIWMKWRSCLKVKFVCMGILTLCLLHRSTLNLVVPWTPSHRISGKANQFQTICWVTEQTLTSTSSSASTSIHFSMATRCSSAEWAFPMVLKRDLFATSMRCPSTSMTPTQFPYFLQKSLSIKDLSMPKAKSAWTSSTASWSNSWTHVDQLHSIPFQATWDFNAPRIFQSQV